MLYNPNINITQDYHVIQQASLLNLYQNNGFTFNFVVDLTDLKQFIQQFLKLEYKKYSITGYNTNILTLDKKTMEKFQPFIEEDSNTISKLPKFNP